MSVPAAGTDWNSPTTLYVARALPGLAGGRPLSVLDLGCGDGTVLAQLSGFGHDLSGCDLPDRREALRKKLAPLFGDSFAERIRIVKDEETIPFGNGSFDVVYANQVFEHVPNLDGMLRECVRVLRPRGVLLTTFPPATSPVEVHLAIPFAHWLPPGPLRIRYLQLFYGLGLRPCQEGCTSFETAKRQDGYLREQTFYRTAGRIESLALRYFGTAECDTGALIDAKLDMMAAGHKPALKFAARLGRALNGTILSYLVTRLSIAAYKFSDPRKPFPFDED